MARILIDTDVLIDHLKGLTQAQRFLDERAQGGDDLLYSVITRAELFAGMRSDEEPALRALLGAMDEIDIDASIAELAGDYCRRYGPSHNVLLPDALIAASAVSQAASLITLNAKHFPMDDLGVRVPYER